VNPTTTVLRDGALEEIPLRNVVPGDVFRLSAPPLLIQFTDGGGVFRPHLAIPPDHAKCYANDAATRPATRKMTATEGP
jgi:hypothetical protein